MSIVDIDDVLYRASSIFGTNTSVAECYPHGIETPWELSRASELRRPLLVSQLFRLARWELASFTMLCLAAIARAR